MKKRLLSLILVFAMVFGMMPTMALAGDQMGDTVYISVSYDGQYVNDKTGEPMAYIPVSLSELQAIDLDEYGLTEYDYDGQLTALHLYIYTHETLMGEAWSDVDVQGGPGSIFFASGLFGFEDCNLQYYYNGEYPANEEGWGITADQLVLNNGDFFDIAAYTSWAFYSDSAFGFHYFLDNDVITHEYAATAGEALTVTLGRGASYMGSGSTVTEVANYTVSYGTAFGTATGNVTTNTDGQAEITFAEAGTYYLWVDGGYGAENPLDIVSAPGCAKVTVTAPACTHETWNAATCKAPKTCAACGATEGEADPEAHNYVDSSCEYCGEAEPVSYPFSLKVGGEVVNVSADGMDADGCYIPLGTVYKAKVELPAGTKSVTVEASSGTMLTLNVSDDTTSMQPVMSTGAVVNDLQNGDYLCIMNPSAQTAYHVYIEFAPCEHSWSDATCTTPKTCSVCGATEGEANPEAHSYVDGTCEHCGAAEPVATPSYTIKLSEAEELTAGLNYFISVPAEILGKDIIFDFGSGTIKGAMCQRHCSKSDIWTAGEGSTMLIAADKVAAHLCNETRRAEVAEDFDLYLTEGSQMFAFYWWTTANMNGSYIYIEILPAEDAGGGDEEATYTVTLPTNNVGFSVRATSSTTVTAGGEFSFKLNIYDDYKKGENFKVLANGVELTSSDDTYTITNITANQTVTVEGVVEKTLAEKNVTVNAPAGSVVSSGAFHSYFKYDFVEPLQISTLEDGRVQYIVPVTSGAGGFIRVQNPNGVTYWDFGDLAIGKVFNITEEMLFIGNTEYTKDTVYANYEKNGHDTASLYLTANAQGWLDMDTGDTHSLNVFRNWIPVSNSTSNTGVSLPDVTYTVVDVNGNASDVVTVTPDANNSCYADIKAEKAGTAIILVTYDAVYNADGEGGKQFSAIWPENTGVIVVTVNAEDADIQTNITVNEEANAGGKQILDVEHDILFYVGNAGAEYSFKPEDGCAVTISRSTVGNEMTFNGFTNERVTVSEDGTVTLSGLTTGAHIVKVEKDGKTAYQVIRAREVSYKLTHSDGTEVTAENPAQPGETITVQFSKLIDPMGKLSGVYNAKYGFRYTGENGDVITITSTSAYGEYYFGSNPARQRFNVTVPTEWSGMTYTFTDGSLKLEGWGSTFGGHRSTTYMEGKETNTNASGTAGYAAVLPDVVIPVDAEPEVDTTLSTYIFNSDIDGTGWGRADAAYADKLSLFGAGVDALRWDGDTCYITLDKKTESNAGLGFLITYKATMDSWLDGLKATVNGESMTANEMLFTKLTNGTLTAEVYVTNNDIPSQSGTKTFVITVADETACDHEWTEANCTVPKTCKLCGVTRGDVVADGHNYVDGKCGYCGNYVGIDIATGDTASGTQDIRISDFHINAYGSVLPHTIVEDGRATVQIKAPFDELELTISMFGKSGNALAKAVLSINDGAEVEPTSVDKDNNVAVWVGTVTPEWNGNKAEIKVTVGFLFGSNVRNPKEYILTLEKVEETPEPTTYTVTLPSGTGYTVAANGESASPVAEGGSYSFAVTIADGYEASENFAVKANDVELTDVEGVYTISNITADQTVTVEGVVEKQEEEPVEPTGVTVTLSGLHDAQIYNFRLYTYTDGEKGATDLLEGIERIADGYSYKHEIALMPGDYWVEGVDADDHLNGGIAITVDAEHTTFQIQRYYQLYATNSGWVEGTDYTVSVEITDAVGNIRPSSLGQADNYGTMRTSCLYVVGDEVKATFTPIGERADSASAVSVKKKSTYNDYISAKIPQVFLVTITAPAESTVSAGIFSDYYIYDFVEPTVTEDENGVTAVFRMPEITSSGVQGANHFYRVQNPDGVTYWNFAKWTADTEVNISAADLHIGDTSFTKDTVIDDYSKNVYDRADIYLNANHRGYLAMNVGDKHEWNVFRNWMAIESFYNAKVALPDVHYEVINLEGENVLSIEPDENNSSVANMTATSEGTAIVLITYDAMTHAQGQSSTSSKQFSAIWPENTGVVIVTVGEDGTDIDTNMLMDRVNATSTVMDAEHDILFYLGDEGAEFTFTPESGSTVTINRSVIENGEMTFKGFTADGVTTADGIVTLTGLTTGRHIVKVEKDGKANYQIITARGVSYELQDSNGNALTEDAEIRAGDTIKIQFTGLVNPVEKMSGAYNFNARILLEGEDGCVYQSSAGGAYGVYDFSGNPARQVISITLPKYWAGDTYTLNGNIAMSGNANVGLGGHRGFTYAYGFTFREDSPSASLTVSRMPEITLHLAETTFVDGQLVFEDEEGNSIDCANLTIELTDDINNIIIVAEDGSFPCVAGEYSYVIGGAGYRYKTGSFTIDADDVGVTKKIILESSSENAWDGTTLTEPDKDGNGVYLIGTGAELAWFAAQQDAGKAAISGKLIADIDLAGYPWDMKASSSNYATVLDGNGHKIQDLNATVGLFSYLGKDSVIKNLTLYGKVEGTTNAGSIVKYAGGSNVLIENCVNYASVTSTGSNAGGLVGYVYNGATIKNCVNHGAVAGSSSVGGIIGSFAGASVVESCYNTGDITATGNCAGGIFGSTGSAASIIGCYNTGDVSGANYVGGVGGYLDGPWFGSGTATATDCYNIGIVTGTGSNVGGVMGGQTAKSSLIRGYSLADTAADNAIGVVLSEAELKQASLDSTLFGGTCTGYPALLWQTDVTFHEVGETAAETVAPTCLEDGYSLYICSSCEQSAKKDIVNALGHSWCDEGEGAHTHSAEACETCEHCVYTAAVCKVNANCVLTCTREGCEVTKTKDLGGALEHEYCTHTTAEESETCEHCSVTPATCVENGSVIRNCVREGCDNEKAAEVIPFTGHTASGEANDAGHYTCAVCDCAYQELTALNTSDAPYAWIWDEEQQRFESTNQGKGSTTSTGTLTLTLAEEATVSFRYGVSSENGWDKLTITAVTGETNLTIANAISGSSTGTFGQRLAAGTYMLTATYTKDGGGNSGEDLGWISMITVTYSEAAGPEPEQPVITDWQTVMNKTQTYLTTQAEETAPVVGTFKGDWVVLGLARNGITADFMDAYYENVKTYVAQNIDLDGRLHAQKSTDNSRVILGLTAIGKDVTDVAGYNLLKGLSDLNYVKTQGINGPVFALIALDSKDYPTADNATATREALVEYILSKQLTDGGWALDGRNIDDMTPMAIQALAPYYNTNDDVKAAVDKALMVMKTMSATPETYAQMIVALSALGIDCETDERFANVMDNMLSFALENGSFEKGKGSGTNQMSTEQCFYAMVAYNRFKNGQTALYDMSDLKDLHTVEILPCENGSVTVSKSSAMTGETITVTVAPDLGYQISKLTMNDTELTVTDNRATFIMPDETAILEATFVKAEASAQAVAQAMTDLEVKDAEEETYDAIADIKKAYSKLTAAEKLEIADEYRAFQSKVKQFEAYLKAHIDDAVDELEYFFDDLDEEDYSKKAWKKIEDLYEEALEAVKAARFEEEVYELLDAYLEDLEEAAAGELEVTFRLIGDWKHDDGVSGHDEYVTWIETTEYNMPAGSTIYDLFIKAIDDFDLNQKGASKNYVESIQAPDILGGYWIGEFDNGPNSGWMYTINGYHPGYGLKEQDLEDGDEVIWHYVDDYTLEERKTTSKYYERWLEADDIAPETWVKRNLDKIVTIEGKGEVKPELKMSHIGKDVKFTFTPAEGWVIKSVYVDGKDKGAIETYTYKDLAMDARIEVVFAQNVAFQMNFADVSESQWFYDDVYFAVSNGLFNGIDEVTFAPGASMTRAMLVTVLYRLEGQPAIYGGGAFADVEAGQWYTDAVIWATRNGIVNGLGNGKFGANDNVTREQMAAILYRYAQNCGYDTTARANLNGYTDAAKISTYAQEAMSWANAMGLINGRTATALAPTGTATRAEVAAIFHRFVENIAK